MKKTNAGTINYNAPLSITCSGMPMYSHNYHGNTSITNTGSWITVDPNTWSWPPQDYNLNFAPLNPSEAVKAMEEKIKTMGNEFLGIKGIIFDLRNMLGMPNINLGQAVKLSTLLREIQVEIDKRLDMFGTIVPPGEEDFRV